MKQICTIIVFAFCCAGAHADICPSTYPNNIPGTDICYLITAPGEYVPTAGAGATPCPIGDYCPGGDKIYNTTNPVPERYKMVEYLENNNTAYIDTGYIPTPATTVNADVMITGYYDPPSTTWIPFVGTRIAIKKAYGIGVNKNTGGIAFDYFNAEGQFYNGDQSFLNRRFNVKTQILDDKIYMVCDNVNAFSHTITDAPEFTAGIYLFKLAGDNTVRNAHGRFYYYQTYESDELVQSMIPVYDTETQQYGMYDLIGDQFFASASSDNFTGGPFIEIDFVTSGGNLSCATQTHNEFTVSPPKSDDITDCGRTLHIGSNKLYMRRRKIAPHALAARVGDTIFYAEMTTEKCGKIRINLDGVIYSICNTESD